MKREANLKLQIKEYQRKEWLSMSIKPSQLEENLSLPRLEIRWHDDLWENNFLGKLSYDAVADLCLVTKFGDSVRYDTISRVRLDDVLKRENLDVGSRMKQDAYSLIYQLKLPCYVSFKNEYRELVFPNDKLDLSPHVLNIMKEDKLH